MYRYMKTNWLLKFLREIYNKNIGRRFLGGVLQIVSYQMIFKASKQYQIEW